MSKRKVWKRSCALQRINKGATGSRGTKNLALSDRSGGSSIKDLCCNAGWEDCLEGLQPVDTCALFC